MSKSERFPLAIVKRAKPDSGTQDRLAGWYAGLPRQAMMEMSKMFARKAVFSSIGRTTVMATVAALAITAIEPSPARAGSAASGQGLSTATEASGATDFSARRRAYRGGGAAAAAIFAGIVGTGIAIAASQNRRAYYDDYYGGPAYYGGGPAYYDGPVYYGGGPYYGGRYYGSAVPRYRGHPLASW